MMIAIRSLLLLSVLLGLGYPMLVTGLAKLLFPFQAAGSLIYNSQGELLGSSLIGQAFDNVGYFHGRPSANHNNGASSAATNLPLDSQARRDFAANLPYRHPALLSRSGSGVDPDLPLAAVIEQIPVVAKARGMNPRQLKTVVMTFAHGGILGPKVVNVFALNRALDKDRHAR
ncbi:potassium-transporting ATPase subunit C [Gallaecimonas mangrovi]|uniref:potassium-transporting ATPase subunit C n=1 Tax=Gallaecimonas mangrovi TaxID=2291597 RepID=UPI001D0328ED|nr:potassium-transporting ATPase subunit C [Gallaecimonas mangrovi]